MYVQVMNWRFWEMVPMPWKYQTYNGSFIAFGSNLRKASRYSSNSEAWKEHIDLNQIIQVHERPSQTMFLSTFPCFGIWRLSTVLDFVIVQIWNVFHMFLIWMLNPQFEGLGWGLMRF